MPTALTQHLMAKQPTTAVFDLDGTLLSPAGTLTEIACSALRQLRAYNIGIVIATGRSWRKIQSFWPQLESTYPVICACGRVIYDPGLDRVLYSNTLDPIIAVRVRKRAKGVAYVLTETPSNLWCPDAAAAFMARQALGLPRSSIRIGNPELPETLIVGLYLVSCSRAALEESFLNDIATDIGGSGHLRQEDARWLSIFKPSSKSGALDWLCRRYRLSLDHMIAFGDGENDLELFKRVGFTVAPANALEVVKQTAHWVTRQAHEFGVYEVVSEWIELLAGQLVPDARSERRPPAAAISKSKP